jgi:hypothetical protein
MDAPPSVVAEIGFEKPRGDGVTGMAHHRQGRDGQRGPQQHEVIVAKTAGPVRREGIADSDPARRVAARTEAHDFHEIVGSAGGGQLLENWKIELSLGAGEPPTQMPPGVSLSSGGFRLLDQMGKGAVEDVLFILIAAFKLLRLNGMEITPPGITVATPLGMQCPHAGEGAP